MEVAISDAGDRLGTLTVEMPPGRALRPGDAALLRDLADQTVVAFRNALLAAELEHELEQLSARTADLAESRTRLITAGDAERDRLERAIARDVGPHLAAVPERLEALAAGPLEPGGLAPLMTLVGTALEQLREITRGVYAAQLVRSGLGQALRSLVARTGTATLQLDGVPEREALGPAVEGAAYFCAAEAARDLAALESVHLTGTARRWSCWSAAGATPDGSRCRTCATAPRRSAGC